MGEEGEVFPSSRVPQTWTAAAFVSPVAAPSQCRLRCFSSREDEKLWPAVEAVAQADG